jgi:succinyl-diaminopimelate desuccinylase
VPCGHRPNLALRIPGKDTSRTFWIIAHLDVVPPGDLSLWNSAPYELVVDGDEITGRGVEDNQQGLVSGLLAARALLACGAVPAVNLGLMFVADEETGSEFGLGYLMENHLDFFGKDDVFLVPDFGEPSGEMVEIAEKSMFWLKIIVEGRQCHASTPEQGVNSLTACADMILKTRKLYDLYPRTDELFAPPHSTFEATMKEANVQNVNTLPGRDVFYLDSRVLPGYDLDEVLGTIRSMGDEVEHTWGVKVRFETVQREEAAPPTEADSPFVLRLMRHIRDICGNNPRPVGVGGGTVAAFLRRKGFPAVVWSTLNHNAHQPNETSSIAFTMRDAKVMAAMLLED